MNKITLCIFGVNPRTSESFVISLKKEPLSSKVVNDITLEQTILNLITRYIDIDPHWIPIKLINVYQRGKYVEIVYAGQVPIETPLLNKATWEKFETLITIEASNSL